MQLLVAFNIFLILTFVTLDCLYTKKKFRSMFGKPAYTYNNYNNYSGGTSGLNQPTSCSASTLSNLVSLHDIKNEMNQNALISSVYNQINPDTNNAYVQSSKTFIGVGNNSPNLSSVSTTNGNSTNKDDSLNNLFMAGTMGFSHHFGHNYLSAATMAASIVAQQNYSSIGQAQPMNNNYAAQGLSNGVTNKYLNNDNNINNSNGSISMASHAQISTETKLSLTPTSSSLSSASSPNYLSESIESNINHSNKNANAKDSWPQTACSNSFVNKSEVNWTADKKGFLNHSV